MTAVTASDPDEFFASWEAARLANETLKPMGAAGLRQALLVWRQWLAFCAACGLAWDAAQSADIARFTEAIGPRSRLKATSPVTRRRYWRVLRDLYDHALARRLVAANPAEGAKPPATERVPSLALSLPMWEALHQGLPAGGDFKARRNRLALLLMMRAALTVREIIGLTLADVQPCADADPAPAGHGLRHTLHVRKAGSGHARTLLLDAPTSGALHAWLEVRHAGLPGLHRASRLIVGDRVGRSIAPNGLYNICQAHLAHCLVEAGLLAAPSPGASVDPGALDHMGPNTLRNTCIALWFNRGVPLAEIQRRCGLKDASIMSRLAAHLASPFPL